MREEFSRCSSAARLFRPTGRGKGFLESILERRLWFLEETLEAEVAGVTASWGRCGGITRSLPFGFSLLGRIGFRVLTIRASGVLPMTEGLVPQGLHQTPFLRGLSSLHYGMSGDICLSGDNYIPPVYIYIILQ